MMFGYLRPWGELVNDAVVAVGEALLRRLDLLTAAAGVVNGDRDGRMECDGPDAAERLALVEAEWEVDDGPGLRWADPALETSAAPDAGERPGGHSSPVPAGSPTWNGWAIPAAIEVLAKHARKSPFGDCRCGHYCPSEFDWREHVAPLLAQRIGCDPAKAIAALQNSRALAARQRHATTT